MKVVELYTGPLFDIYGLIVDEICLAEEYIKGLSEAEQKRVFALINRILHHGPPQDERKFRHVGDRIYELKTRGGTRILCFYGDENLPNSLILAQGFYKPKNKILMRQKKRTITWRETTIEIMK